MSHGSGFENIILIIEINSLLRVITNYLKNLSKYLSVGETLA